jgi:hypothetical protein
MRQPESVPQHDVFVVEVCGGVGGDPGWEALGGFAGGLRDVAAGGVELGVVVLGKMSEFGALLGRGSTLEVQTHTS